MKPKKKWRKAIGWLTGFSGAKCQQSGEAAIEVTLGTAPRQRKEEMTFVIIKAPLPYNVIHGRADVRKVGIIVSTIHGLAKFLTPAGIATIITENVTGQGG